jgi:prephenate dehydrogenase
MASKIGIIGLGQIGASIGLALKSNPGMPKIVGYDRDSRAAKAAEGLGAVDSLSGLEDVAQDATIVFLSLPLSEIQGTWKRIGPVLAEDTVVFDTAPAKGPVLEWARQYLPEGRYYMGLVPAVSTVKLGTTQRGVEGADAGLFRRTVMMVVAPPNTPAEVEQLAVNVVRLLGAKPMLTDQREADGIMATAHLLPQLTAAALVEASVSAPGWLEARKVAGLPFAAVTGGSAYFDDAVSLQLAALGNSSGTVHALDVLIASLKGLRDDIDRGDTGDVGERLSHSFSAREQWLDERGAAAWLTEGGDTAELPKLGEQVLQVLFGSRIVDRAKFKKKPRP